MSTITRALVDISATIATWIDEAARESKMLFQSAAEIATMISGGRGIVIYGDDGQPVSFAGYTDWQHYREIGALITEKASRGQGFGTKALLRAVLSAQDVGDGKLLIGLCNPDSARMLHQLGFRPEFKSPIHAELWQDCHKCLEYHRWPDCHCQFLKLDGKVFERNNQPLSIIALSSDNTADLLSTAKLYTQVWREPPWNETEWDTDEVVADLLADLVQRKSCFMITLDRERVIGFSIGYRVDQSFMRNRFDSIAMRHFSDEMPCYYIADLAVDSTYRHLGIGQILSESLIDRLDPAGTSDFILRTHQKAYPAQKLYERLGFFDTHYPDPTYPDRTYWRRISKI